LANLAYENPNSLDETAKALKMPIQATGFFDQKGNGATGIFSNIQVLKAAFSDDVLRQNYNSDVLTIDPQTQLVVRLAEHEPAVLQPLEKVKPQIVEILKRQAQYDSAKKTAEAAAIALTTGENGESVASRYNISFQKKNALKRDDNILDSEIISQAFLLQRPIDKEHPTTTTVEVDNGDIAVIALYNITQGQTEDNHDKESEKVKELLNKQWANAFYNLYLESLHHNAKIKKYVNFDKSQPEESA
jgi:peptidyl-prolyl cis-trans isomerase D